MARFFCKGTTIVFLSLVTLVLQSRGSYGQTVPAIFIFGDSLVDTGNNNYLALSLAKADFPYNGIDFPETKATGRFSNGKNAADFLAEKVLLPSPPPYLGLVSNSGTSFLGGVNFASGGARLLDSTYDPHNTQSLPFGKQVEFYLEVHEDLTRLLGSAGARNHLAKSLFIVVIGSNDILDYSQPLNPNKDAPQVYVGRMVALLKEQIKTLYVYGARKFVVVGVPPVGCWPAQRILNKTRGCREDTNAWTVMFNEELLSMMRVLKSSELKDMSYSYSHTYAIVRSFIQDPASHGRLTHPLLCKSFKSDCEFPTVSGFSEVNAACCGLGDLNAQIPCLPVSECCPNRRDHLFWDLYHPTESAARLVIDNIFDGPAKYTSPINVRRLISL